MKWGRKISLLKCQLKFLNSTQKLIFLFYEILFNNFLGILILLKSQKLTFLRPKTKYYPVQIRTSNNLTVHGVLIETYLSHVTLTLVENPRL